MFDLLLEYEVLRQLRTSVAVPALKEVILHVKDVQVPEIKELNIFAEGIAISVSSNNDSYIYSKNYIFDEGNIGDNFFDLDVRDKNNKWVSLDKVTLSNGIKNIELVKDAGVQILDIAETENDFISMEFCLNEEGDICSGLHSFDEENAPIINRLPIKVINAVIGNEIYTNFKYNNVP